MSSTPVHAPEPSDEILFTALLGDLRNQGHRIATSQRDDGSMAVVEFKTGTRRASHQRQLDIHVAAARALFPKGSVDSFLMYPE